MDTSKETHAQKISENTGESTTKNIHTQKLSESKTSEKPTQQNSGSSNNSSSNNKNNGTNSSNKNRNSNTSGGNFTRSNTSNTNSSKISSRNTSINASTAEARKTSLPKQSVDLGFPSDLSSTKEVLKRNSANKIITAGWEDSSKPVQIEVKTYTAPPNASAVIEVRPTTSNTNEIDVLNNPEHISWPMYQYPYPQQINGPQSWYMQNYQPSLPSSLTYVPTEELVHSQSFSNTPGFGSQLLYQYPVNEAVFQKPTFSPRPKYVFSNYLNNQTKLPKPNPKDDHKLLPNYAVDPLVQISPYQINKPPKIQFSSPQGYFQPYLFPQTNGIQNSFYIQDGKNLNSKPAVTKYVTQSYTLKTHPKLEWVPL
jgi:hypothetical protein